MEPIDAGPRPCVRKRLTLAVTSTLFCLLATACASLPRELAPPSGHADAVPVGFAAEVRWPGESTRADFRRQAARVQERVRLVADGDQPINVLALSGGGAGGAFGAGVLTGWSRRGTRPTFQIVTGVSAGALIAPMAFLGPAWDRQLAEAFAGSAADGLLRSQWEGALFGVSVFMGEPLKRLVNRFVTDDLLRAVAAEAAKGRLLLVATTDLDRQALMVWDMGAIAMHGGDEGRRLFRDVLLASASVPGVFPPVLIRVESGGKVYDEMHVDGGTTASLIAAPDIGAVIPHDVGALRGAHMYILINGRLGGTETTTSMMTASILERSVGAALKSVTRGNVEVAYAFARRHEMTLWATAVPNDYPYGGSLDFAPSTMKSLFEYGERCAEANRVWDDALEVLDRAVPSGVEGSKALSPCPRPGDSGPQDVKADDPGPGPAAGVLSRR